MDDQIGAPFGRVNAVGGLTSVLGGVEVFGAGDGERVVHQVSEHAHGFDVVDLLIVFLPVDSQVAHLFGVGGRCAPKLRLLRLVHHQVQRRRHYLRAAFESGGGGFSCIECEYFEIMFFFYSV